MTPTKAVGPVDHPFLHEQILTFPLMRNRVWCRFPIFGLNLRHKVNLSLCSKSTRTIIVLAVLAITYFGGIILSMEQ